MPRIESTARVGVDIWTAFAVSQTTGDVRLRWDPFIKAQHHLDGAAIADAGVRTLTTSRHGLKMVSEYTSFRPPERVGMKMVEGPWFFERFGGGWLFTPIDEQSCDATWRYTFTVRPTWLQKVADPLGVRLLRRDIDRRIDAFARGCADAVVLARAADMVAAWQNDR